VMRRQVWMEVETCGDCWTVEESVLIFIYTPVISISLASKPSTQNRPILLAIIIPSPTIALLVPYLLLFCLSPNIMMPIQGSSGDNHARISALSSRLLKFHTLLNELSKEPVFSKALLFSRHEIVTFRPPSCCSGGRFNSEDLRDRLLSTGGLID